MVKKRSLLKFVLKNHTFLKQIKYFLFIKNKKEYSGIEKDLVEAKRTFNYDVDILHPRTFNEHLLWLKHFYKNDLWCKCADKLGSKEFLTEKGFSDYLPKVYGVFDCSDEIDLNRLPDEFVLKTNHDSGSVFVCKKDTTNFKEVFRYLDNALNKDYALKTNNNEWVYTNVVPKIFVEEKINHAEKGELIDYKFFVFGGEFGFGFTGQNRSVDTKFCVFDKNFNFYDTEYIYLRPSKSKTPNKPLCWTEMIGLAERIGKYFDFVRVDMYWTDKGIRVGELTFFSQSGLGAFTNKKYDFEFGKYFDKTKLSSIFGKQDTFKNKVYCEKEIL